MIDMDYTDIKWQQLLAAGYFLTIETPSQLITVHMPINGELLQRFGLYITPLDRENKADVHLFKNFTEAYEAMQRMAPLMDWQVHCQEKYTRRWGAIDKAS